MNGNGFEKDLKKVLIGIGILLGAAWVVWVSTGNVNAKIDNANLCNIAEDVCELKGDVKKIKDHFMIP